MKTITMTKALGFFSISGGALAILIELAHQIFDKTPMDYGSMGLGLFLGAIGIALIIKDAWNPVHKIEKPARAKRMKRKQIARISLFGLMVATLILMYLVKLIGEAAQTAGSAEHTHPIAYVLIWAVSSMPSIIFTLLILQGEA